MAHWVVNLPLPWGSAFCSPLRLWWWWLYTRYLNSFTLGSDSNEGGNLLFSGRVWWPQTCSLSSWMKTLCPISRSLRFCHTKSQIKGCQIISVYTQYMVLISFIHCSPVCSNDPLSRLLCLKFIQCEMCDTCFAGNPHIGVLKHKEKLYVFNSKEAALKFACSSEEFIAEVAEKAKYCPELIQLLKLHQQFSCISPHSEVSSFFHVKHSQSIYMFRLLNALTTLFMLHCCAKSLLPQCSTLWL